MKSITKILLLLFFCLRVFSTEAQNTLKADSAYVLNGIEYGYTITNSQTKEDYERYEVRFFVANNSNCNKYIIKRTSNSLFGGYSSNKIAEFSCINATGKRFTSKGQIMYAKDWYVTAEEKIRDQSGREVSTTKNLLIGYLLRNGETVTENAIIITPLGEKPIMKVTPVIFRD